MFSGEIGEYAAVVGDWFHHKATSAKVGILLCAVIIDISAEDCNCIFFIMGNEFSSTCASDIHFTITFSLIIHVRRPFGVLTIPRRSIPCCSTPRRMFQRRRR